MLNVSIGHLWHTFWLENISTTIYLQSHTLEAPVYKMDTMKQPQTVMLQVSLTGNFQFSIQTRKN